MISIAANWKTYFKDHDEGLGTTYERFILHRHFERIKERFSVRSVVEIPSFGMTGISGINSMWWALQGIPVTVVDDNKERIDLIKSVWIDAKLNADCLYQSSQKTSMPFADKAFDMGWNFASLWFVPDLDFFLKELTRITRNVIFICVPNRLGLGLLSRRMLRKDDDSGLYFRNIIPGRIKKTMVSLEWKVSDQGFLDVPPWPDIAMKKEDLFQKIGMKGFADKFMDKRDGGMCVLDHYSGKSGEMEKEILKYAFLENSPWVVRRFWAHHEFFIFTRS